MRTSRPVPAWHRKRRQLAGDGLTGKTFVAWRVGKLEREHTGSRRVCVCVCVELCGGCDLCVKPSTVVDVSVCGSHLPWKW